ncbi:MAG TPA: 23S ribosomal RNA methyltransferase Erm [Ktedonobacterales bacterium]|jgi:23S rRNA (adenine-N6)-dimethyltransferase
MSSTCREGVFYAQHFLKDARLVAALLNRCAVGRDDVVYEIGPGKGIITEQLALRCKRVVAIEKDSRLAALLLERFADRPQVTIHAGDFLEYRLPRQPYKVVANIPFNITAAIVARLTGDHAPEDAYLAMQQEAAAMFLGEPRESLRTLLLKPWFEVELVHRFRRQDFVPEPQVDVVMLRLRKRGPPLVCQKERQGFRDFVVYGFTRRQPTLADSLKGVFSGLQLRHIKRAVGFDDAATPTMLTVEQWLGLFACFQEEANAQARRLIAGSEQRLVQQQGRLQKRRRTRLRV